MSAFVYPCGREDVKSVDPVQRINTNEFGLEEKSVNWPWSVFIK